MQTFYHVFINTHFGVWIIILSLLFSLISYFFTKNAKHAFKVGLIALAVSWLTVGIHFWEIYLSNHFMGAFNQYGLPSKTFRTGWLLMVDAWVLWVIPAFVILLVFILLQILLKRIFRSINQSPEKTITSPQINTLENTDLMHELEIQELNQQIETLKQKYREQRRQNQALLDTTGKDGVKFERMNIVLKQENEQLHKKIAELQHDLERCKILIEKLLEEK